MSSRNRIIFSGFVLEKLQNHDDDLVPAGPVGRRLREIKDVLDGAGVKGLASIGNLHGNIEPRRE